MISELFRDFTQRKIVVYNLDCSTLDVWTDSDVLHSTLSKNPSRAQISFRIQVLSIRGFYESLLRWCFIAQHSERYLEAINSVRRTEKKYIARKFTIGNFSLRMLISA